MKKFIVKVYIIITLLILILSTITLISFNIADLMKNEEKTIISILNIIENLQENNLENEINNILNKFNLKRKVINKDNTEIFEKYSNIVKNKKESLSYDNKVLYYVKEYDKNIILLYKNFNLSQILIRNGLTCIFIILLIAIILYILLKKYLYKNIILPLEEISKEIPKLKNKNKHIAFKNYKFEEINCICKEIINIQNDLQNIGDMLKIEKNKIDYILDNMTEGFVLFDKNKNVFAINKMAKKILNYDKNNLGENILYYTQNIKLLENIDKALSTNQKSIFDIKTEDNKTYSIHISKIQKGIFENGIGGIIMLIIDVTAERESEKLKQEFFSNKSDRSHVVL